MNKTLYYIQSKKYKDIVYKCFDKEETLKYMQEEELNPKYYQIGEIKVNLDEFFKIRTIDMPKYLTKLIKDSKNDQRG